jgi:hypothetical protein
MLNETRGYGPILSALVKEGFVTMRVEKTGEGDSEGPACADLKATAELEAKGYAAALDALSNYDFVDPKEIFVFAHSLGALLVSLALPGKKVGGVIAGETIGRSWFEYTQENVRRQSALSGEPLDQVDADVRAHVQCAYHFYVQHESADEVAKLEERVARTWSKVMRECLTPICIRLAISIWPEMETDRRAGSGDLRHIRSGHQRGRRSVFDGHHQQLSSRKRDLSRDRRDGSRIWPLRLPAGIPGRGRQHLQAPSL